MPEPSQHAFSEKVALVVEGSGPYGRACALQLAMYGCYVILCSVGTKERDGETIGELTSLGTLAKGIVASVDTEDDVGRIVGEVDEAFGRLDILVNSVFADGVSTQPAISGDLGLPSFSFSQALVEKSRRLMDARPKPKIVSVVSNCDAGPNAEDPIAYSMNKAVEAYMFALSQNLPSRFRANCVAVSEVEKPVPEVIDPDLFRTRNRVDPDDVARAVVYLLSGEAIGVNGQVLRIN